MRGLVPCTCLVILDMERSSCSSASSAFQAARLLLDSACSSKPVDRISSATWSKGER